MIQSQGNFAVQWTLNFEQGDPLELGLAHVPPSATHLELGSVLRLFPRERGFDAHPRSTSHARPTLHISCQQHVGFSLSEAVLLLGRFSASTRLTLPKFICNDLLLNIGGWVKSKPITVLMCLGY